MDYVCEVVPNDNLQQDCHKLISDELDIIFGLISKITNADCICSAIKLCSAVTEKDLLNTIKEKIPKNENDSLKPEVKPEMNPIRV